MFDEIQTSMFITYTDEDKWEQLSRFASSNTQKRYNSII